MNPYLHGLYTSSGSFDFVTIGENIVDMWHEGVRSAIRILDMDGHRYWLDPYFKAANPERRPPGHYFQFAPKRAR